MSTVSWNVRFADLDRWDARSEQSSSIDKSRWPVVELRQIADIRLGTQLQSRLKDGTTRPYLRAANVQEGYINLSDVKSMIVTADQAKRLELYKDDLLFVEGNSLDAVGRAAIWPGGDPTIIQNSVIRVRLTAGSLDHEFVVLWFNSFLGREYVREQATTTSGSLWHIGAGKLAGAPLPVPPVEVQRRVVETCKQLKGLISETESAKLREEQEAWDRFSAALVSPSDLAGSDELTKLVRFVDLDRWDRSTTADTLGSPWPVAALGAVSQIRLGAQVPRRNSAPVGPAWHYLRAANIKRGYVDMSDVKQMHVTEQLANALELKVDDLLFVEGSGSPREVGRCAVWDASFEPLIHQNSVIRARLLTDTLNAEFAATWFNSPAGSSYIRRHATTTSGLYHIGAGKLTKAPIPLPPLSNQRQLTSQLRRDLAFASRHIARAAELRKEAREVMIRELLT